MRIIEIQQHLSDYAKYLPDRRGVVDLFIGRLEARVQVDSAKAWIVIVLLDLIL